MLEFLQYIFETTISLKGRTNKNCVLASFSLTRSDIWGLLKICVFDTDEMEQTQTTVFLY